jgi:hypothetical protein
MGAKQPRRAPNRRADGSIDPAYVKPDPSPPLPNRGGRPPGPPSRQVQFRLTAEDLLRLEELRAAWRLPDRTSALRQAVAMAWVRIEPRSTRA